MNYTATQRANYNHDREITCERLGITENQYNWFRKLGQALHKEYENQCNGFDNTFDERNSEAIEEMLNIKGYAKAKELGLHIFFQTDPRGATIYLSKNVIPANSYNTSAECIY